jgi:hypothetical protein
LAPDFTDKNEGSRASGGMSEGCWEGCGKNKRKSFLRLILDKQKNIMRMRFLSGAGGRTRTGTVSLPMDLRSFGLQIYRCNKIFLKFNLFSFN